MGRRAVNDLRNNPRFTRVAACCRYYPYRPQQHPLCGKLHRTVVAGCCPTVGGLIRQGRTPSRQRRRAEPVIETGSSRHSKHRGITPHSHDVILSRPYLKSAATGTARMAVPITTPVKPHDALERDGAGPNDSAWCVAMRLASMVKENTHCHPMQVNRVGPRLKR